MSAARVTDSRAELLAEARRARAALLHRARQDPAACAAYVLRHEKTGKRIRLAPMHYEWHELLTSHRRLIIWSHVEGGKTQQISIGRSLYEIGQNPAGRWLVVSSTAGGALKISRSVKRYIEASPAYREVFPHVRPATPWTDAALTVERSVFSKDPTFQACGARGHVVGSRLDGLILDDILDYVNTLSRESRQAVFDWLTSEIMGRLTDDAPVWVVGNAYYKDDALHRLASERGYTWRKYPVVDDKGRPNFPQEWPPARIKQKTDDLGGEGHPEARRQLYCEPRSDESSRVKQAWIDACMQRGLGLSLLDSIPADRLLELQATAHSGVDLGVKKKRTSAKSVVFTVLRLPNGDVQVVGCKSGRWGAREIVKTILFEQARFNSQVAVESNGAQQWIVDNAHEEDAAAELVVLPFHTGANKMHPVIGVESVFMDLARARWIIPSTENADGTLVPATPELREWCQEMLDYTPDAHTGDHLMASWFAREDARLTWLGREALPGVGVSVFGAEGSAGPITEERAADLQGWEAILKKRPR